MNWEQKAHCKGLDTELFYPHSGKYKSFVFIRDLCDKCPVSAECLDAALSVQEEEGFWAGTSYSTRKVIRRFKKNEDLTDVLKAVEPIATDLSQADRMVEFYYERSKMLVL